MLYSVVFYTKLEHVGFQNLRKRYDPYVNLIDDHISLVFPIPDMVGHANLISHVRRIADSWKSFDVHINGLEKSWDNWLLLKVSEGHDEIVRLHDKLYTGPLAPYLRSDIQYSPHVGIGLFVTEDYDPLNPRKVRWDSSRYKNARAEAESLGLDWWRRLDEFTVVKMDEGLTHLEDIVSIKLGV
jgi:hypothetical protein